MRENALEQITQMVRRENVGVPPQVQFLDARRAVEQRPVTGPFSQDRLDVGRLHAVALGDVLVAPQNVHNDSQNGKWMYTLMPSVALDAENASETLARQRASENVSASQYGTVG